MNPKSAITTKKLVLVGLLAALTCAGSALRIKVPADIVGTSAFHLGNILCALSGILLGPWFGALAAGIGSAIYDMFDPYYISECWLTFLMKGFYGLAAGGVMVLFRKKGSYFPALLASLAGALTYAVLYLGKTYFYSGRLMHGLTHEAAILSVISKIPATTFNAVVAVVAAPILAVVLRKALTSSRLLPN